MPLNAIDLAATADVRLGPIVVRLLFGEMTHDDGRWEVLEPRVIKVFVALALSDGIVGRSEPVDRCWGGRAVSEAAINLIIWRVRRLSEEIGSDVFGIETITKVCYRLVRIDREIGTDTVPPLVFAQRSTRRS